MTGPSTPRLKAGDAAPAFDLPSIAGDRHDLESLRGRRALLSFYRFAACPFCNLRLRQVISRFGELSPGLAVVAVFDSPLDHLRRQMRRHEPPFPVLADERGDAYAAWRIERSAVGVLRGMLLRFPTLLRAMFGHGFLPLSFRGSLTTMPADFLLDENGIVRAAHYGSDEGDHLDLETITAFADAGRRSTDRRPRPQTTSEARDAHA